tara:strand:+ start:201 stop:425 length:225 start_codon:yes stop_codon:yes gene_type:complete
MNLIKLQNNMTEQDIINEFVAYVLPYVQQEYEQDGIVDGIARRENYNNYVDYLREEGLVSEELANVTCLPDSLE